MKQQSSFKLFSLVWLTICMGLILSILPMPGWSVWLRPQWVLIIVFFWVINSQGRVGIFTAWLAGILLDLLTGTLLGQHALVMVLLTYVLIKIYYRFHYFSMTQQTAIILFLVLFNLILNRWLMLFMLQPVSSHLYWFSALTSAIMWPFITIFFQERNSYSLRYR
jgi:rod shape-determining protein MreD